LVRPTELIYTELVTARGGLEMEVEHPYLEVGLEQQVSGLVDTPLPGLLNGGAKSISNRNCNLSPGLDLPITQTKSEHPIDDPCSLL
jgi:hypothetical protein